MSKAPPEPLYTFRGSMTPIHCLLPVVRDGSEFLYAGTNNGKVHVWNLLIQRTEAVHDVGSEACLSIIRKDSLFLTQQKGEAIKVWEENDNKWKLQKVIINDYCGFCNMCLLDNSIFLPDNDSKLIIYNFTQNKEVLVEGKKELGQVMCMRVVNSLGILVAYEAGDIYLWSETLEPICNNKFFTDCPMAMDFCDATNEGIIGTTTDTFYKFKLSKEPFSLNKTDEGKLTNPGVASVALNKSGKLCVLGCWDGRIRYFSMKSLKLLAVLSHHADTIQVVVFIEDKLSLWGSGLVAAGGKDNRISLWNLYSNQNQT